MIPTLEQVLSAVGYDPTEHAVLMGVLRQREDAIKETLMMTGANLGLHAEFMAEVFANSVPPITLGTTPSDEARQVIHANFIRHIEELRRQQGDQT